MRCQHQTLAELPGAELVLPGLDALQALARGEQARWSPEALLVLVGAARLRAAGLAVPDAPQPPKQPELALYDAIADDGGTDAHARYNALIRRLVSFERALEAHSRRLAASRGDPPQPHRCD